MSTSTVTILHREPSEYVSTFHNEIVTCRLQDGRVERLLLKQGGSQATIHGDPTYGHRGGVSYEAEVYRSVLEPLAVSTPDFHAAEEDAATGETSLLIEYVDSAIRLEFSDPSAIFDAARWIGVFHRLNESRVAGLAGIINRYDEGYYLGWSQRTLLFSPEAHRGWLAAVCRRFESLIHELIAGPQTIIHGEYYPKNILVRGELIVPVDWESAAIAPGEIDLASLAEGWPEEDRHACETAYRCARWPEGAPAEFDRRQAIATMYLLFRWLGDRAEWARGEDAEVQFAELRGVGEQLGAFA